MVARLTLCVPDTKVGGATNVNKPVTKQTSNQKTTIIICCVNTLAYIPSNSIFSERHDILWGVTGQINTPTPLDD